MNALAQAIADEIEERGLYQGSGSPSLNGNGPCCVIVNEASRRAFTENLDTVRAFDEAWSRAIGMNGDYGGTVAFVNSHTQAEVVAVLRSL